MRPASSLDGRQAGTRSHRSSRQEAQPPGIGPQHQRRDHRAGVSGFHMPVPGRVEHPAMMQDQQGKGGDAQPVKVVSAISHHGSFSRPPGPGAAPTPSEAPPLGRAEQHMRPAAGESGTSGIAGFRPGPWTALSLLTIPVILVNATSALIEMQRAGLHVHPAEPFIWEITSASILVLMAPMVGMAVRRWPLLPGPGLVICLVIHAGLTVPFSLVHVGACCRSGISPTP